MAEQRQSIFAAIKSALGSATGELSSIRAKLKTLRQRREFLLEAPLPRVDVEAAIVARIDRLAAGYPRELARYLQKVDIAATKPAKLDRLADFVRPLHLTAGGAATNAVQPTALQESALAFCMGDVLKARLAAALQACELVWPVAGPPAAARATELRELEVEIATLEAAERELLEQLRAAIGGADTTSTQPNFDGGVPTARVGRAAL